MKYKRIYKQLQSGRYFYTIWCRLDDSCIPIIQKSLETVIPYCKWVSTYVETESDSKNVPHITLRYLGFADELDAKNVKKDKEKFERAIRNIKLDEITVGKFQIWKRYDKGTLTKAMLNWEIIDDENLLEVHNSLLKIPGYYFFEELEGENYHPHISLGEINLEEGNLGKVEELLGNIKAEKRKLRLENFAINLADKDKREGVYLKIKY